MNIIYAKPKINRVGIRKSVSGTVVPIAIPLQLHSQVNSYECWYKG